MPLPVSYTHLGNGFIRRIKDVAGDRSGVDLGQQIEACKYERDYNLTHSSSAWRLRSLPHQGSAFTMNRANSNLPEDYADQPRDVLERSRLDTGRHTSD